MAGKRGSTPKQIAVLLVEGWVNSGYPDPRTMDSDQVAEIIDENVTELKKEKIDEQVEKTLTPLQKRLDKNLADVDRLAEFQGFGVPEADEEDDEEEEYDEEETDEEDEEEEEEDEEEEEPEPEPAPKKKAKGKGKGKAKSSGSKKKASGSKSKSKKKK